MQLANEELQKKVKAVLQEISGSMTRIEGEREFIKEAINHVCKEYELDKKVFRRMAKVYHKQNFSEEVAIDEEFQNLYGVITGEGLLEED